MPLVVIDATFFSANLLKLFEGAWVPLLFGIGMVLTDPDLAARHAHPGAEDPASTEVPLDDAAGQPREASRRISVPGTAVFLTSDPDFAPTALLHNLKHNKVLHEHNVVLTIVTADTPRARRSERVTITPVSKQLQPGGAEVRLHGDARTCRKALAIARKKGLAVRHHVDVVLPVAARAQAFGAIRHADGGRTACSSRWPRARQRRHRLLPDPDRAGGRGGTQVTV